MVRLDAQGGRMTPPADRTGLLTDGLHGLTPDEAKAVNRYLVEHYNVEPGPADSGTPLAAQPTGEQVPEEQGQSQPTEDELHDAFMRTHFQGFDPKW